LRYRAFKYADFDLAIHSQTIWNILHGSVYSSILGIPFLGNHLNLILFLLTPFYIIFSSPLTLLLLQSLFLGLAVIPLYFLARDILDKKFAFIFSLLYLTYPSLHFVNRYEFHPVSFSIFFLLFMFYYFEKEKYIPFLCFMFLSLLCKENISLGIFFFGLYILLFRKQRRQWSLVLLPVSLIWFIFGLKLMNFLNKGTIDFNYLYSHIGRSMPEVLVNITMHPGIAVKHILTKENMKFLFQLFFPLGFLSLLSPKVLFISIPFFLQQLLSVRPEDHTIAYHYTAKLIPFLFISAIYGTRLILRSKFINRYNWFLISTLLIVSVISNISFGLLPKMPGYFSSRYAMKDIDYIKQDLIDKVPKDASVVATFEFLPKLSGREKLYSFHHVYSGTYTLSSSKKYVLPEEVEYALVDFDDYLTFTSFYLPQQYRNLQKFFANNSWGILSVVDNIVFLKKGYKSNLILCQMLEKPVSSGSARFLIDENLKIWGYDIGDKSVRPGQPIHLSFIWECIQEADRDYWVAFKLVDRAGKTLHKYNHPICYRIYPTYAWEQGDILKENIWILAPFDITAKDVWLKMSVFDRGTAGIKGGLAKGATIKANARGVFDKEGWINLGKVTVEVGADRL
jgi:uncharacterized membrane protein